MVGMSVDFKTMRTDPRLVIRFSCHPTLSRIRDLTLGAVTQQLHPAPNDCFDLAFEDAHDP